MDYTQEIRDMEAAFMAWPAPRGGEPEEQPPGMPLFLKVSSLRSNLFEAPYLTFPSQTNMDGSMKSCIFPIVGISILLVSCLQAEKRGEGEGSGVVSVNPERFEIDLPVGEKRLLLREYITTIDGSHKYHYSIGVFEIVKDTIFNGNVGKIVSSTGFELYLDTTRTHPERSLIVKEGNQVNVYTFGTEYNGFLFGLLKRSAYDTTVFGDRMAELEYPLFLNKKWSIRDSSEPNLPFIKEFVKLDTLTFDGMKMQCEVFDLHGFVVLRSWVSRKGLLKAEFEFGDSQVYDTLGNLLGTQSARERYELLKLNPSDQDIEEAKAKYRALTAEFNAY
jgi:hypothetical protein